MIIQPRPSYDQGLVAQSIISNYQPSIPTLFKESVKFGFRTMWWQEALDEIAYDSASQGNVIPEDVYKESEFYRPGISWFDGMTVEQAEILAENHDRNAYYGQLTQNVSGFSSTGILGMFGGLIAGGFADPLNFIPYYGIAKQVSRVKGLFNKVKVAKQAAKTKPTRGVLGDSLITFADPIIGAGIANLAIADKRSKFQEQHDLKMVLMDMAVAGGIGGTMVFGKAVGRKMRNVSEKTHMNRVQKALDQLEEGKSLDLRPHPTKGLNYEAFEVPESINATTRATVQAAVKADDDILLHVIDLGITGEDAVSASDSIKQILDKAEAEGYAGIALDESILRNNEDIFMEDGISHLDIEVKTLDGEGGTEVVVVKNNLEQDVKWDYVDGNKEFEYTFDAETESQSLKDAVKESINRFTELPSKVISRLKNIEGKASQVNEKLTQMKNAVRSAAHCVITNG
tara:strand:+ start:110 stop:1480 length:1371 start_codon:yes stop_codon:yes gene_type:complete